MPVLLLKAHAVFIAQRTGARPRRICGKLEQLGLPDTLFYAAL